MASLQDLLDHHQITTAIHRYAHGLDANDSASLSSAFTEDATLDFTPAATRIGISFPVMPGLPTILAVMLPTIGPLDTSHTITNIQTDLHGDEGKLTCLIESEHYPGGEGPKAESVKHITLMNRYEATVVRVGNEWKMKNVLVYNLWAVGDTSNSLANPKDHVAAIHKLTINLLPKLSSFRTTILRQRETKQRGYKLTILRLLHTLRFLIASSHGSLERNLLMANISCHFGENVAIMINCQKPTDYHLEMPRRMSPSASAANFGSSVNPHISFMTAKGHPTGLVTSHVDAVFKETIRKFDRCTRPQERFIITPGLVKNIVLTENPQNSHVQERQREAVDAECNRYVQRCNRPPPAKYASPITSAQEYGWHSSPLLKENCPFAHHPRRKTQVTQLYGQAYTRTLRGASTFVTRTAR
ncbi:uncharacterized protein SPPG_04915 [Spizellomyces punctatus DAOM BR117]|uniref:SnoaL-like domain-containing protein n=1 Tax=Spizellomyces punctatus (strain DAOM BR117) TaxID=645134 RepID=A0A0L0HEW1_SPIPD|nr:uncharacterized protein SPPG_04915 [Spizellomyces punctatus DAOM BR117]KNC99524.1 hypothetical protein SPPG_04915 [Spizellomyces punctatus DAOM BR117]|eukprot:XP_016607564.1 hypothetical protein SPPG_04915 [Spizellomyces punctatus DAOM BR117]